MRIDKQLEAKQIRRDMCKRFKDLFWSFESKDYENPVTKASILEAIKNIKLELDRSFQLER